MENYKEIRDQAKDQKPTREKLFRIWLSKGLSNEAICRQTGLARPTLKRFLENGHDVNMATFYKIKKYVDSVKE